MALPFWEQFWPLMEFLAFSTVTAIAVGLFARKWSLTLLPIGAFMVIGWYLGVPFFSTGLLIVFILLMVFLVAYKLFLQESMT